MKHYSTLKPCTLLNPVPAVMVSAKGTNSDAVPNIVTIAWVGTVNSDPPMVSISLRRSRHTYQMITDSGEFVVNLADRKNLHALDWCGVRSGRDYNKFQELGLQPLPVPEMKYAPAIDGVPAYLACQVHNILELGSHDMVIGEVKAVRVLENLLSEEGKLWLDRADLVCYSHGIYHAVGEPIGFFGCSVAKPDVFKRRMGEIRSQSKGDS